MCWGGGACAYGGLDRPASLVCAPALQCSCSPAVPSNKRSCLQGGLGKVEDERGRGWGVVQRDNRTGHCCGWPGAVDCGY